MSKQRISGFNGKDVLLYGYYKKLKTMKRKFFVLCNETSSNTARLEYYDNEKKFKSGFTPKRIIQIKNCFNINRRLYTKHKFVIALASKEGGFGIVMDSEDELNTWLNHLLHLQRTSESCLDFPNFDNVWQAIIQKKGVAELHNLFGSYHICLTNKSITLIKIGYEKNLHDKQISKTDVLLTTIRRCGDSQCYFYMEIGRQSSLGPGELWMETEDSLTAQNMHRMILSKMISLNEVPIEPMRKRSSSATESTNLHHDRQSSQNVDIANNQSSNETNFNRERCDSLPSRNRSCSDCTTRIIPATFANRVINFHINNTSPLKYSASEESVTVDDSEESTGMPNLLSSRSPDGVIPEEYVDDTLYSTTKVYENQDTTSLVGPGTRIQHGVPKMANTKREDICRNVDNQLHFSPRTYSIGSKCDNDLSKEALINRVRAYSVGSKNTIRRVCLKTCQTSLKNDNTKNVFVENSTRKSISVPDFINKSLQSVDQMGDLMEIDFSKLMDKPVERSIEKNKKMCQNILNSLPPLNISDSIDSIPRNTPSVDNGYLEMKPITPAFSNTAHTASNQQIQYNTIQTNNSDKVKECSLPASEFSKNYSDKNDSDVIKICDVNSAVVNQDLYYASLDLPKCGNDVNTRYEFKESISDTSPEEIKNEYAKINFDTSDTSCSLKENKK